MSVRVMGLAWYVGDLTPAQKVVLLALADHSNDDGKSIYPSAGRLTYKTSLSERAVRRALSDLRNLKLIKIDKKATFHSPTEYSLDLPQMQVMQIRPAINAPLDLPEVQALTERPARSATEDLPEVHPNHHINHQLIEEEEALPPPPNLFKAYEQEIGPLTPMIAEALKDAEDQHTEQWVIEAIHQASAHSARSWSYIKAILARWAKDGYGKDNHKPAQKGGAASSIQSRNQDILKHAAEKRGIELFSTEVKHGER